MGCKMKPFGKLVELVPEKPENWLKQFVTGFSGRVQIPPRLLRLQKSPKI